jgi:hypothetical protein
MLYRTLRLGGFAQALSSQSGSFSAPARVSLIALIVLSCAVSASSVQIVFRNSNDCDNNPPPAGCDGGTPLSRNEHPRLIMTLDNRDEMLARIETSGEWNSEFQEYIDYMTNTAVWDSASGEQIIVSSWAAGAGFVYQMFEEDGGAPDGITFPSHADTQAEWGAKGVEWLTRVGEESGIIIAYTRSMFLAYDWLHPALSSQNKTDLVTAWKTNLDAVSGWQGSEAEYPDYDGFFFWNSEYYGYYGYWVLAGLTAKGDGVEEAWLQTGIDRYSWAFHASSPSNHRAAITRESQRSGTDGGGIQGWYYGQVNTIRVATMEIGYRTAHGITPAAHYADDDQTAWMKSWVPYITRTIRPWTYNEGSPCIRHTQPDPGVEAGAGTSNSSFRHAAALARHEFPTVDTDLVGLGIWFLDNAGCASNDLSEWYFNKFISPKGTAQSPTDLGLVGDKEFFGGKWQWRSGWGFDDALVTIHAWRFGALNGAGQITIDYNGPMLPLGPYRNHDDDSGHYGYGRNQTCFVDTTRTTFETSNGANDDFGCHRPGATDDEGRLTLTEGSVDDMATTPRRWRTTAADGVGYLSLNLLRHYNSTTASAPVGVDEKITAYRRSIIYVPPDTPGTTSLKVFVFDAATTTDTVFQKRQQWNSLEEPTVTGGTCTANQPVRNGSGARKTECVGSSHAMLEQSTALSNATRLFVTPLAPSGNDMVKVQWRYVDGSSNRLLEDSYGTGGPSNGTWSGDGLGDYEAYGSWWKVEIIPAADQVTDVIATVLEGFPDNSSARSTTAAVTGTGITGGRSGSFVATHTDVLDDDTFTVIMPDVSTTFSVAFCGASVSAARTLSKGASIGTVTQEAGGDTSSPYTFDATGCFIGSVVVTSGGDAASRTLTWN